MKFFTAALALSSTLFAPVSGQEKCEGYQAADVVTMIDLFQSVVVTNTLHEKDGEIRYNNVGTYNNNVLDLVVTITSGDYTDIEQVWIDKKKGTPDELNGRQEGSKFGNINLQTTEGNPKSGEGNFRFCFVNEGENDAVTLDEFSWTIYDTDERSSGIKEKMIMDLSQAELYQLVDNSEIVVQCEDGSTPPCQNSRTVFESTVAGKLSDNPSDPNDLTDLQKKRSVSFTFQDTSCWEFTYDHFCPKDQPEWEGTPGCGKYTGGNFLFSGSSKEIRVEGKCETTPPVTSETPAPTMAPPACPEDVRLLKINGVTDIDLGVAVRVVSQDTSTVTVRLTNSLPVSVDSIFYNYQENPFNEKCYEKENVGSGETYEDITIQCLESKPYADFEICIADNGGALVDDDNAEISKCCEHDLPPNTPAVCYKILVECQTSCAETVGRRALRGVAV